MTYLAEYQEYQEELAAGHREYQEEFDAIEAEELAGLYDVPEFEVGDSCNLELHYNPDCVPF